MALRRKAAVFRPPEPTPTPLPSFSTVITQVRQPTPITISRPRRDFIRPVTRPQIIATRPATASLIPFQETLPRIPSTPQRRFSKAERVAERKAIARRIVPPKDDVEVIAVRGQMAREQIGFMPPISPIPITLTDGNVPAKLRGDFFQFAKTGKIVPIQKAITREGKFPAGKIISAQEAAAPRFGSREAQAQIAREAGVGDPALVPFVSAFQSFTGGARQEFENIGSIAGIGTARPEAGSLIFGLPFEVGGATFTREAPEGQGFAGLGFEFDFNPERGAEISGEIQRQIVEKFEEDPFRAAGSVVTAGTIEAAIFVGTGGVGRVGLTAAKKFTQIKGRKIAERLRLDVFKEKGVDSVVENVGKNTFFIVQGTETAAKRGIVLSPFEAVAVGFKKSITGELKLITAKLPTIRGLARARFRKRKGKLAKIPATKAFVKVEEARSAEIPLIVVQTNVKVTGQRGRKTVVTTFTRKDIKNLGFPTDATIKGVTDPKLFARLGLEKVGEKATIVQGKLKGGSRRTLIETTEAGKIVKKGEGAQFLAEDFFANPKGLRQIALTGKNLRGESARLTTTQIFEAEALGGAKIVREVGKGIDPSNPVFIGSKAEARELAKFGLGDITTIPKKTITPFNFAVDVIPISAQKGVRGAAGVGGAPIKGGAKTVFAERPTQAVDDIAQIFRDVGKASVKQSRELRGVGVPLSLTGFRTGLDFDVGQISPVKQRAEQIKITKGIQNIIPALDVDVGIKQRQKQRQIAGLDFFAPPKQRTITRSLLDEGLIRTPEFRFGVDQRLDQGLIIGQRFDTPFTPLITVPTRPRLKPPVTRIRPSGFFPFLPPFGEPRRRKKGKKRKSRLGGRLFDVATEPFGEVAVGLGFFIEQATPEQTIAEAIGTADIDFEPITRQERQARQRLGRTTKRRRNSRNQNQFDFLGNSF